MWQNPNKSRAPGQSAYPIAPEFAGHEFSVYNPHVAESKTAKSNRIIYIKRSYMAKKTAKKGTKASRKNAPKKIVKKSSKSSVETQSTPVQPLFDRVLVRKEEPKDSTTPGGIYLPETSKKSDSPKIGVILAIGEGRIDANGNRIPMSVSVGMKVLFTPGWSGADVLEGLSGNNVIIPETDILAILNT